MVASESNVSAERWRPVKRCFLIVFWVLGVIVVALAGLVRAERAYSVVEIGIESALAVSINSAVRIVACNIAKVFVHKSGLKFEKRMPWIPATRAFGEHPVPDGRG